MTRGAHGRNAFTLIEILVVIIIIALLATVAIPSFQAMIRGSEETLAEGQLGTGLRQARDAALRASSGSDSAAAFMFTADGRCEIAPYVKVTTITDVEIVDGQPSEVVRDLFVPAPGLSPVSLPRYWTVRGFVGAGVVQDQVADGWFTSLGIGGARYNGREANWVFPETSWHNPLDFQAGAARNTFIVRFEGGTGRVLNGEGREALLLSPDISTEAFSTGGPTAQAASRLRYLIGSDPARYVRTVLQSGVAVAGGFTASERRFVLGRQSSDMILARPVSTIALASERLLAEALGARLTERNALLEYSAEPRANDLTIGARFVDGVTASSVNRWMNGDTNLNGTVGDTVDGVRDEFLAKIYVFDRYTGAPRRAEVEPETRQ